MNFDWVNLLVGGGIGFVVGVCVNAVFAWYQARCVTYRLRKKFAHIAGPYLAYPFKPDSDDINYAQQIGKCEITCKGENILEIRYDEIAQPNSWQAVVWMETPFFGSMTWRYIRLHGQEPPTAHRFGFKRCVASTAADRRGVIRDYFYLVGEKGFGNEALEKVEKDH